MYMPRLWNIHWDVQKQLSIGIKLNTTKSAKILENIWHNV